MMPDISVEYVKEVEIALSTKEEAHVLEQMKITYVFSRCWEDFVHTITKEQDKQYGARITEYCEPLTISREVLKRCNIGLVSVFIDKSFGDLKLLNLTKSVIIEEDVKHDGNQFYTRISEDVEPSANPP